MIRTLFGFLLALATVATVAPSACAGQFNKARYYSAGLHTGPYWATAAHLTNSGNLDLVVADAISDEITILLGNGDGTFQKPLRFAVPYPIAVAVGDFNDDGIEDLAVAEYGSGVSVLSIFLGEGNGKFHRSAKYPSGASTTGLAIADFDGSGHNGVAVADNSDIVMVFPGTGKGTLKSPTTYKLPGAKPWGLAAGDLNGDGYPDLAVATILGESVAILINDGKGKFGKPTYYTVNGAPVEVNIADLRNDGRQDLVVADLASGLDIWLNNGDGTFGQPTIYVPMFSGAEAPEDCAVADFNLDGNLDVACAAQGDDSYFFYGKGDGTFGSAIQIADTIDGQGGFSIASGDFNNDGAPDLAIPIQNRGKVAVMLNTQ